MDGECARAAVWLGLRAYGWRVRPNVRTDGTDPTDKDRIVPLLFEQLTRSVIGGFYDSYSKLGYGFYESVYVNGLCIELARRKHRVEREVPVPVYYDGEIIGAYKADLIVDGKLIVEVKAEAAIDGVHQRQLRNYLACTTYEVGLILCYGLKPQFKRMIHTRDVKAMIVNPCPLPSNP